MFQVHNPATFWGSIAEDYAAVSPPSGFQGTSASDNLFVLITNSFIVTHIDFLLHVPGLISWLFLPSVALGMYLNVPVRFIY